MAYFSHRFAATICRHAVGSYHYTVVYLPADLAAQLPFDTAARLRIEADVSGVPVRGAWQPSGGRWYLMLPRTGLRQAGLTIGSAVEVAFRLLPQDQVDLPAELAQLLQADAALRGAWQALTPGRQRGLAYMVSAARKPETRAERLRRLRAIVLGEEPAPWARKRE